MNREKWKLFSPIDVAKITLKNRIYFPPYETGWANVEHWPMDRHLRFLSRIAASGIGLITIEAANVNPKLVATKYGLSIADDKYLPAWKKLVDELHKAGEGVKIFQQIVDKTVKGGMYLSYGDRDKFKMPAAFSKDEINDLIEYFAAAARRVKEAGFDGLMYHSAATGAYTLGTFRSRLNTRTDEYGGSIDARMRLTQEIHKQVRKVVGPDFPIADRLNPERGASLTLSDSILIVKRLDEMGIDFIDPQCSPGPEAPPAYNAWQIEWIKHFGDLKHTKLGYAGKVTSPEVAEWLLQTNKADLVGWGRPLFRDPDFVAKILAERDDEIEWCVWDSRIPGGCLNQFQNDERAICRFWNQQDKDYYRELGKPLVS